MTNKMAMNKINDFELNKVAGGTLKEFKELFNAYENKGKVKEMVAELTCPGSYIPYEDRNILFARVVEKALKQDFNIDAYISVGFCGTGFRSVPNTYSLNGKTLSHQEVLNIVKAA